MTRISSTEKFIKELAKLKIPQDEQASAQASDEKAKVEEEDWKKRARRDRYEAKTKLIKEYAKKLFWFMVGWTIIVIIIIVLDGIEKIGPWTIVFNLPASVLVTLVSTTMVQVIGLFAYVAYYLFKSDKD